MKIAFMADVHANIYALESVYADLAKESVERIFIIGDLVGYYYWPKEVLSLLMNDERVSCVRGNHEKNLNEVLKDPQQAHLLKKKYGSGYEVCLNDLNSLEISWLLGLPKSLDIEIAGHTFHLSHGGFGSIDEYLYPDATIDRLELCYSKQQFTIFGHTHYSFLHSTKEKFLLNPGSVGQPRDMSGLASYIIFDSSNSTLRFKRIPFDVGRVTKSAKKTDPQLPYLWNILKR